jgi:hypothetical protein
MKRVLIFLVSVMVAVAAEAAPKRRAVSAPPVLSFSFDFRDGSLGWSHGFADYSPVTTTMNLIGEMRSLPPVIGTGTGYFLSGDNRSDDLFMFLTKQVTVKPSQRYVVDVTVKVASNAGSGCFGVGGAPGESVYLKAGASAIRPEAVLVGDHYRMNVDIGSQSQSGTAASVAGNIANGLANCSPTLENYVSLTRAHRHAEVVQSSASGDLWILVGTDSAYEGTTALYYQRIDVQLIPVP